MRYCAEAQILCQKAHNCVLMFGALCVSSGAQHKLFFHIPLNDFQMECTIFIRWSIKSITISFSVYSAWINGKLRIVNNAVNFAWGTSESPTKVGDTKNIYENISTTWISILIHFDGIFAKISDILIWLFHDFFPSTLVMIKLTVFNPVLIRSAKSKLI